MKKLLILGLLLLFAQFVYSNKSPVKTKTTASPLISKITRTDLKIMVENKYFRMRLIPRTPDQMSAFYYARGFPQLMIKEIEKACLITIGITNKTKEILWMDLGKWDFNAADNKKVRRYNRQYWFALWKKLNIPLRFQSTFRWTLIPAALDYRAEEREGGNITLARTGQPFNLNAVFYVGQNKGNAKPVLLKLKNIRCADNPRNAPKKEAK